MTAAYDQVVAALLHLTPDERDKIAQRLKMMQSLAPGQAFSAAVGDAKPTNGSDLTDELLEAICATVLSASGERATPVGLRRTPQFRSLREKADALDPFLRKHFPDRTERRAFLAVAIRLLYDVVLMEGQAGSARTLMLHAHRLPAVIDSQFPGYAASGWLRQVVKMLTHEETQDVRPQRASR